VGKYEVTYNENGENYERGKGNIGRGRHATQTLLEAGHRRIGFTRTAHWRGIFGRRERGWRQAMEEAGMEAPVNWSIEMDGTATIGAENLTALYANKCQQKSPQDCRCWLWSTPIHKAIHRQTWPL
jgi:DNA-binding LacI/PurR family transcriptional regulator